MRKSISALILIFFYVFLGCSSLNRKSKLEVDKFCASVDNNLMKLNHITDKSIGHKCNVYFKKTHISKIEINDPFYTVTSIYFYKSKPILIIEKVKRDEVRAPVTAIDKDGKLVTSVVFPSVDYIDTLYI